MEDSYVSDLNDIIADEEDPDTRLRMPYISVDNTFTRDMDDAFRIERWDDGWRLDIAIADASVLVQVGDDHDKIAFERAQTLYTRQGVKTPMLPPHISNNGGSLVQGRLRPVMKLKIRVTNDFDCQLVGLKFGKLRLERNLRYEDIPGLADQRAPVNSVEFMLSEACLLGRGLLAKRRAGGAMAFYDLRTFLYLDEEGLAHQADNADDTIGHIVIQEFMILSNALLAEWAVINDVPFIYRNHRPKLAAPPIQRVMETFDSWVHRPDGDLSALRGQLALIVGKANYEGSVGGHYSLNLPAYAHCTSPLRRYVDLVNLRQIKATCKDQSFPYDQRMIEFVATKVDEKVAAQKQERSEIFKATVKRRAERALHGRRLDLMGDSEISQAIKYSAENASFNEEFERFLVDRLNARNLPDSVLDDLFQSCIVHPDGVPLNVKVAWGDYLRSTPHMAKHFIVHGVRKNFLIEPTVEFKEKLGGFIFAVRSGDGAAMPVGVASAPRKKDAENLASARFVMQCSGLQDVANDRWDVLTLKPKPSPSIQTNTSVPAGNPKGILNEYCQKNRLSLPEFHTSQSGPPHRPSFSCAVVMKLSNGEVSGKSAGATSLKQAETMAAADLLSKILI